MIALTQYNEINDHHHWTLANIYSHSSSSIFPKQRSSNLVIINQDGHGCSATAVQVTAAVTVHTTT